MVGKKSLDRAQTAESVGVSSVEIQAMIDEMIRNDVDLHSIMVIRHGKVAAESWRSPLFPDAVHMVYSVSKSFTAAAFGIAVDEGYISLDAKVLDILPELRPAKKDEYLEKLTVLELIAMRSGKRAPVRIINRGDWIESLLKTKWVFKPGEDWRYINENYYLAVAAIVRATGMSLNEYLTPRLYEPLGIDVPVWETSPAGIEAGGWGMFLKTEDVAKFVLCCLNDGIYDGRQVIPAWWIKKATSYQSDNSSSQSKPDSKAGYGYGFWMCEGLPNTFRCEGLYSQYGIAIKDYDACIITTSSCANLQLTLDIIWNHIPKAFTDENSDTEYEHKKICIPPYPSPATAPRSCLEQAISGKEYKMRKNLFLNIVGLQTSIIPMPGLYLYKEHGGNIDDLSFTFDSDSCEMAWSEKGKYKNKIMIAMDGGYAKGEMSIGELRFETLSYAFWKQENILEIHIKPLAVVADRVLIIKFNKNRIVIAPDTVPGMEEKAKTIAQTIQCVFKGKYYDWWIKVLTPNINRIIHPKFRGKLKQK